MNKQDELEFVSVDWGKDYLGKMKINDKYNIEIVDEREEVNLMEKFKVILRETYAYKIEVEAENVDDAYTKVGNIYVNDMKSFVPSGKNIISVNLDIDCEDEEEE